MNRLREVKRLAADAAARTVLRGTLREVHGNISAAARALGESRSMLRRELARLGLRRPDPLGLTARQRAVYELIRGGTPIHAPTLAVALGVTRQAAHDHLKALCRRGLLVRGGDGVYDTARTEARP